MKNLKLILRGFVLPFVGVTMLSACGEKSASVQSTVESSGSSTEEEKRPKLEEVIRGVWMATSPEEINAEKIQLDFRGEGEVTMIVFNPSEGPPTNGVYEVSGDELQIQFDKDDPVKTTYDGKTLTVIDVNNDQQVAFEKW